MWIKRIEDGGEGFWFVVDKDGKPVSVGWRNEQDAADCLREMDREAYKEYEAICWLL